MSYFRPRLGIDFSTTSPAACLSMGDGSTPAVFYSLTRSEPRSAALLRQAGVRMASLPPPISPSEYPLKDRYLRSEQDSAADAVAVSDAFTALIDDALSLPGVCVGIEGFSKGSKGSLKLEGFQYVLRAAILRRIPKRSFFVFTPATVKKAAGKGSYTKDEMIRAFINGDDVEASNTELWSLMADEQKNNFLSWRPRKRVWAWEKPIDDIVDAYWVMRCIPELPVATVDDPG